MLLGGHDHWKVMEPDFLGKIFASPVVRDQDQFNDFIRIFFFSINQNEKLYANLL